MKKGDIVYLKSGSPPLVVVTVESPPGASEVFVGVAYHFDSGIQTVLLPVEALTTTKPE